MKREKIFYQFYKAIEKCTAIGADKHSYKKSGCEKIKIFSYEDRRNIIKVTSLLCDYLEEFYPEIQYIKDINTEHVQSFFIEKANYCTKSTMKNYNYCIRKLEKMVRQELHLYVNYTSNVKIPNVNYTELRTIKMSDADLQIIINECDKSKSKAVSGIKVAIMFGLRVSEVCKLKGKDIRLNQGIIHVHDSKGKRCRDIKIETEEQRNLCEYIKSVVSDEDRICPLREDTVNVTIKRMLLKNKISRYKDAKTGIHSIRKAYATKEYEDNLRQCTDQTKAWNDTALKLGHNEGRTALKNAYVKDN
ncbi:tyrosine-type recombinase/integrase [Clostridium disporicum]|nr:site-specific integrase [Clostridium disporicum]